MPEYQEEEKVGNRGNNEQDYSSNDLLKTVERKEDKRKINTSSFVVETPSSPTEHSVDHMETDFKRSSYYSGSNKLMMTSMSDFHRDMDQSMSSMQVTNYEDSELMITAYKKKKAACDKFKRQLMKTE